MSVKLVFTVKDRKFMFAALVKDKKFIAHIKESKYDIAFTHMYNYCPIGIIHLTSEFLHQPRNDLSEIPTWIWMSSADLTDNIAKPWECPCHLPIALVRICMCSSQMFPLQQ